MSIIYKQTKTVHRANFSAFKNFSTTLRAFFFCNMDSLCDLIEKSPLLWSAEYESEVKTCLHTWQRGTKKTRKEYHIYEKFALKSFAGIDKVISKKDSRLLATKENVLNIIKDIHVSCGHKGEKKTHQKVSENYSNISRKIVTEFIKQCERCVEKVRRKEKSGVVVRPILAKDFNERGQIDLVDMQSLPDGPFRYIMHYQDHLSKFHFLRALKTKTAAEVAINLFKIFIDFGAPQILQSDNGREFTAKVIQVIFIYSLNVGQYELSFFFQNLKNLWPELILVNGRPRYPQSQGSVEKSNGTVKSSLTSWMRDHKTSKWTKGLFFTQWGMNITTSEATNVPPYRVLFGMKPKIGLATNVSSEFLVNIDSGIYEEDLMKLLDQPVGTE